MDFTAFDTILGYLAAFAGISFSLSLAFTPRTTTQIDQPIWLALATLVAAMGFGSHSYAVLSIVPALLTPFIESSLRVKVSRYLKFEIFICSFLFVAFSGVTATAFGFYWRLAFYFYIATLAIYFFIASEPRSILRGSVMTTLPFAVVFASIECAQLITPTTLHEYAFFHAVRGGFACLSFLLFIHSLSTTFLAEHEFVWAQQLKRLVAYASFSIVAAGLLNLSEVTMLNEMQFCVAVLLLFSLLLSGVTFFTLLNSAANSRFSLFANVKHFVEGEPNQISYPGSKYGRGQKQI